MTTTATDRTGDLCDAETGELIGPATFEQITALADIVAEQHAPGCSCGACWTSEHNAATRWAE